jgi:hypothetical protein
MCFGDVRHHAKHPFFLSLKEKTLHSHYRSFSWEGRQRINYLRFLKQKAISYNKLSEEFDILAT